MTAYKGIPVFGDFQKTMISQHDAPPEPNIEERLMETLRTLYEAGGILDEMLRQGHPNPGHEPQPAGIILLSAIISQESASLVGGLRTLRDRLGNM